MGALLSRSKADDRYYASYEKAFERLEKESSKILDRRIKRRKTMETCSTIGFWVVGVTAMIALIIIAYLQRTEAHGFINKASTILGACAVPVLSGLLFRGMRGIMRWQEVKDEKFLKKLMDSKRKMVKDLKDSTRFDRTMALIRKYDPDDPGSPRTSSSGGPPGLRRRPSAPRTPGMAPTPRGATTPGGTLLIKPAAAAATAAASVAAGTGKVLMPVFEHLANNIVGDSPALLEDARRNAQQAQVLKQENDLLRQQLQDLKGRMDKLAGSLGDEVPESSSAAPVSD